MTNNRRTAPVGLIAAAAVAAWCALPGGRAADPPARRPVTTTSAGGIVMIRIPAGEFRMGSDDGQTDEKPVHRVRLGAFYMDRHPVTQGEFERLMGRNPCRWKGRPTNPAEQVRWSDAVRYCNARSRDEGLEPCYDLQTWECDFSKSGYRLPTEAEWEYACRAGTKTKWFFGDRSTMLQVYAWYGRNSGRRPRPVGRKRPNPWGLCDMVGNVWEWCNDYYRADYYKRSPPDNPRGPKKGSFKVVRGGSWESAVDHCRSSARFKENPAFVRACFGLDTYGFRCVRRAGPTSRRSPATAPAGRARTAFVCEDICLAHKTGAGHPERPERISAILAGLKRAGLLKRLIRLKPRPASVEQLAAVHSRQYIRRVRRSCRRGLAHLDSRDTPISARSYGAAVAAAGGAIAAVDAVVEGRARNAFCAVRPPGHHALKDRAMGFCLFNNVAVAARHARTKHRLARVLIIDWDVHHGNGTQAAFYDDPGVMYFSTHRWPFYPGTGRADRTGSARAAGTNLNVPLPAGSGDAVFKKAFTEKLLPAAMKFKPDLILISAGFDAHADDPLGGMKLTAGGYAELTRIVKALAEKCCKGKIVSVLEGGYNLAALAESVRAHVAVLAE